MVGLVNTDRLRDLAPPEAVAVLREALGDESELVREHAAWALGEAEAGLE